jgi:hypothetical protein
VTTTTATTHVVVVVVMGTVTAPIQARRGFGAFKRLVDGDERGHRAHAAVVAVGAGADLAAEPGADRRERWERDERIVSSPQQTSIVTLSSRACTYRTNVYD